MKRKDNNYLEENNKQDEENDGQDEARKLDERTKRIKIRKLTTNMFARAINTTLMKSRIQKKIKTINKLQIKKRKCMWCSQRTQAIDSCFCFYVTFILVALKRGDLSLK